MNANLPEEQQSVVLPLNLVRKADQFLDDETQQKRFADLGRKIYDAFSGENGGRPGESAPVSSQLRNLQQIAVSASRFSEIANFVKRQMGRTGKVAERWRKVGEEILNQLEQLEQQAARLAGNQTQRFLLRLYLARGWIRAVVGGYMFEKALREMGKKGLTE
jgi:hypothetical protein